MRVHAAERRRRGLIPRGKIAEYGVALGEVKSGVLIWGVITATNTSPIPGTLAGTYAGAGADVAVFKGLGANAGRSAAATTRSRCSHSRSRARSGFNLAAGVTTVSLEVAPAP